MKTQFFTMPSTTIKTLAFFCLIFLTTMLMGPATHAQNNERTVKGVVTTNDGPLEGATVVLKGTSVAASTDAKGAFIFPKQLQENDVLVVSFLGYKNQEITIAKNTLFVEPFLEDIAVVIVAALRTEDPSKTSNEN